MKETMDRFIIPHQKQDNLDQSNVEMSEDLSVASCLRQLIQSEKREKSKRNSQTPAKMNKQSYYPHDFVCSPSSIDSLRENSKGNRFGLDFNRVRENPVFVNKPERNLEAITLTDNHQASLLDCSPQGILAVGLSKGIYLWNDKGEIHRIREKSGIWSLKWSNQFSNILACGSDRGSTEIWDVEKRKLLYQLIDRNRGGINSISWKNQTIYTGSQDGSLFQQDLRVKRNIKRILGFKDHEILTVKFQPNNDHYLGCSTMAGKLKIWDARNRKIKLKISVRPQQLNIRNISSSRNLSSNTQISPSPSEQPNLHQQTNVIRAFDWHPRNHNMLVYGDNNIQKSASSVDSSLPRRRSIKIINISQHSQGSVKSIQTCTQTCSIIFSTDGSKLYSSHGPTKNEIYCWNTTHGYQKQKVFAGHESRVLYLTLNQVEKTVISGAGDESIKFWKSGQDKQEKSIHDHCLMQVR